MPADTAEAATTIKWPNYREGDFAIRKYMFHSGEVLPELKLHYRTLGIARRNAAGKIVNGVLLLQGNTGTGANWLRPSLADELFAKGQPLDAAKYFMIMPDAIGRGGSSKPLGRAQGRVSSLSISRYGRERLSAGHRMP
jgi:homoserine O-acetyltransferase